MYRIVILLSAFLLSVAGMLYVQGADRRDPADLIASVDPASLKAVAQLSAPASQALLDAPSTGATALAAAVAAAGAPADPAADDQMAAMTANVLASLGSGNAPAPASTGGSDLQGLVAQALRQGQSDAYIETLLNEAAATGRVAVPEALMSADGKVDTRTLLASIVRQARAETDSYTDALVAEATTSAPGAAAPLSRPGAASQTGARYYTVAPGDSLARIAMVFYGSPAGYTRIFEANRAQIASPDMIRVGQTLLIPG